MQETSSPGPHETRPHFHVAMDRVENLFDFRRLYNLVLSRWWIIAIVVGFATLTTIGYLTLVQIIYVIDHFFLHGTVGFLFRR